MAKIDWGEKLELKIRMLPESPGCYLMKDKDGTIIYVGKAVNLKNRVRSYFRDTEHTPKVAAMIPTSTTLTFSCATATSKRCASNATSSSCTNRTTTSFSRTISIIRTCAST